MVKGDYVYTLLVVVRDDSLQSFSGDSSGQVILDPGLRLGREVGVKSRSSVDFDRASDRLRKTVHELEMSGEAPTEDTQQEVDPDRRSPPEGQRVVLLFGQELGDALAGHWLSLPS